MASFFTFILALVLCCSILAGIFILGALPNFRNTPLHNLHNLLFTCSHQILRGYNWLDVKTNGRLLHYINWLVPIGYTAVVTFCIHQFLTKTIPLLPYSLTRFEISYITFTIALVYLSTILAVFSDPGKVTSNRIPTKDYPFIPNQLIFFDKKVCSTCHLIKPARSKHCSICGHCYLLYDHHCVWINNCVGYYNYKWFLLFLIANINMLGYGGWRCYQVLVTQTTGLSLFWQLITKTTDANKVTGVFLILCSIFIIITTLFTALHFRYIYLGVTTNELDKWSDIEYLVRLGVLYKVDPPINNAESYVEKATSGGETVYLSLNNDNIVIDSKNAIKYTLMPVVSVEHDLVNIYDRGFWLNLKERL